MPAERFQKDRLALSRTDVGDLREDDRMVPLGNLIDHVPFDPARAIREHGEAGRGPLRLHFLERPIEHQFGDVLRALSDERDGERLRSSDIREGPAIFAERERNQGRLEGGLHQPRAEHQPVLSVLGLCADDVRAVWNLLEDFLLDFLVHRPTGPPNDSVANQVMRKSFVGRPFVQIDSSTRSSTCIAFRVMSCLSSPGFSSHKVVVSYSGAYTYTSP